MSLAKSVILAALLLVVAGCAVAPAKHPVLRTALIATGAALAARYARHDAPDAMQPRWRVDDPCGEHRERCK